MTPATKIYVRLVDESVDVRRPVTAERIAGDRFRVADQSHDRGVERWEFEPGDEVLCTLVSSANGPAFLAATRRAQLHGRTIGPEPMTNPPDRGAPSAE
jgi:hypothetical protein